MRVASIWLLTLEKNGCHNLLRAGADGVVQVKNPYRDASKDPIGPAMTYNLPNTITVF